MATYVTGLRVDDEDAKETVEALIGIGLPQEKIECSDCKIEMWAGSRSADMVVEGMAIGICLTCLTARAERLKASPNN